MLSVWRKSQDRFMIQPTVQELQQHLTEKDKIRKFLPITVTRWIILGGFLWKIHKHLICLSKRRMEENCQFFGLSLFVTENNSVDSDSWAQTS